MANAVPCVNLMAPFTGTNQVVIQQGDKGDHFYVIESGEFDVFVAHGTSAPELVHTYTTIGGTHASFGELSLMYGKPRAATVKAKTKGTLWRLNRRAFCGILHKKDNKAIIKVLRSVEVRPEPPRLLLCCEEPERAVWARGTCQFARGSAGSHCRW